MTIEFKQLIFTYLCITMRGFVSLTIQSLIFGWNFKSSNKKTSHEKFSQVNLGRLGSGRRAIRVGKVSDVNRTFCRKFFAYKRVR